METNSSMFQTYTLLILCSISLSCISYSGLRRNSKAYRFLRNMRLSHGKPKYSSIPGSVVPFQGEVANEDDHIIPQDTKDGSVRFTMELQRPRGARLITLLECCLVLATICVNITTFSLHVSGWDHQELTRETLRLAAWIYIAILVCLRVLFFFTWRPPLSKLWHHTASLYCVQWLFALFQLYFSAKPHTSAAIDNLQMLEFGLSSCLALIAISTRNPEGVVITHQAELIPNKEPFASILSLATFNWVNPIVWHGNKNDFNLSDVWDLQRRDRAGQLLQRFGRLSRRTKLAWRLLSHFKLDLIIQMSWSFLGALLTFAPTLLLKAILEYMENPKGSSQWRAWLYVTLLAVSGCMYGIADGQAAWMGRKNGMHMESILMGGKRVATSPHSLIFALTIAIEIHAETLKRKIKISRDTGTITNLLSVDSFQVGEACSYVHDLFPDAVTQFVVAALLLFSTLGKSALASFVILALLVPLNAFFGRLFTWAYRDMMKGMDSRSDVTNEVLRNVRLIKVSFSAYMTCLSC
jgi:ABC transporter transmembrane region